MKSVKQIMTESIVSPWRGSEKSEADVRKQIREKYGDECADEFQASTDAMPYRSWASYNFRVKRGERALKSITILEIRNEKDEVVRKVKRTVNLFHRKQVEKIP
ncbi:MAG TPA: hypothetical protein VJJ24_02580 [Candidatus Paceibacterota bacterium]